MLVPRLSIALRSTAVDLFAEFGRSGPLIVDVGFGSGETTLALAEQYPDANVIGIETHENGLAMLAHEADRLGVTNVRLIAGDAFDALAHMISPSSISIVQIVCPDPWPKPAQAHRRLFSPAFAALVAERLVAGGELRLATDWEPYAAQMLEVASANDMLHNTYERFAPRDATRPATAYERKGVTAGRSTTDLRFVRA